MPYSHITAADIFACQQCGECCKGYGGTYVTEDDIRKIAEYTNTDPKTFVSTYCTFSGSRPVIAQGENGYCIFWQNKICTIHPVKPRMCKAWPFLASVLTDVGNWEAMSAACPGIRTNFPPDVIKRCIEEVLGIKKL
ncbi:MAG: YkgJ family cysteine cluster protein [Thermodesulfobacteriota bacterium]|nr:YkgJ family cysteine cluster protein [Thermodesulfobacteriota bacterium]